MTACDVVILYNEPRGESDAGAPGTVESDAGVLDEVAAVSEALVQLGVPHRRAGVRTLQDVGRALTSGAGSCVINLVESLYTSTEEASLVPAVCSALGRSWTGNGTPCQLLALDKWQSKCALQAAGVATPWGTAVSPGGADIVLPDGSGSVIVKPLRTDASEGIDSTSVVSGSDPESLRRCVARIHDSFHQPAMVESYINGRELNVSMLERGGDVTVLPIAEIDFSAFPERMPRIVDYRAKWIEDSFEFSNTPRRIPADLDEAVAGRIRSTALAAWTCLGCRDYVRVDMRLDADGTPYVIEVNPNPDISPDAGFAAALRAAGLEFSDFVRILLDNAGVSTARQVKRRAGSDRGAGPVVRRSKMEDRAPILRLVEATGVFRPGEVEVAREVLDDALAAGEAGHYQSFTATVDGKVAGWVCVGPTPCTVKTFDLYWLAVSPESGRRGVGGALVAFAEAAVQALGGRRIVVETSSRADYEPARRFYERHGYRQTSRVPEFYEVGDDKLIYMRSLS